MTQLSAVIDDVIVPTRCDPPLAEWALVRTALDFFTRSRAWRVDLPPLSYRFANVQGITNASPPVVTTAAAHPFETGDQVLFADVQGMREINGFIYAITKLSATTFGLDGKNTVGWPAYSAGTSARVSCPIYAITTSVANTRVVEILGGDSNSTLPEDVIPGFGPVLASGPSVSTKQPAELDAEFPGWKRAMGLPRWVFCPTDATVQLVPAPDRFANHALSLRAVLAPSAYACEIPDLMFGRWRDTLVHGAVQRLCEIKNKPWSDESEAAYRGTQYDMGLRRAGIRSHKGNVKTVTTARPVSYGGLP